jgi:hypothetical protein
MPTVEDLKLLKERRTSLEKYGIVSNSINNPRPTAQWYKGDGTPLPNLLPADPYHIRRYEARGWSMIPPMPKIPHQLQELNEVARTDVEKAATKKPSHVHRWSKAVGSPCKMPGCTQVRQIAYTKRK